ncbi:MAG: iron ABC transporter substrate-binding protein [Nitrososphaera sp.]|jgi:iron(III) transport system substrate-binding protein
MNNGAKYAIIGGIVAAAIIIGVVAFFATPTLESAQATTKTLTIYSGRSENLVQPIIDRFSEETGINVEVRYGDTAAMALAIIEEGQNSPADVFFAQDAGALGALSKEGRLVTISDSLLERVDPIYRSQSGDWVGVTGRARVVDYNTQLVNRSELPDSIWGFTDPKWKGKIGWSPPNGSFQSFITAMRVLEGEERTRQWLQGIIANDPVSFPGNSQIVEAIGRGEISVGFVNNYYLHRFQNADPAFPVAHHYTKNDAGSMVNIAGLGIIDTAEDRALAEQFIDYMLSSDAQLYFATETYEYPLLNGTKVLGPQLPLNEIDTPDDLNLADIDDLEGTLNLLRELGIL